MRVDLENDSCPLVLVFLSDGKPSDRKKADLGVKMFELGKQFKQQLTVCCLGFAEPSSDFSALENMTSQVIAGGSKGTFKAVDLKGDDLSSTIKTISDTMSMTRQMSMAAVHNGGSKSRTLRVIPKD